MGESYYPACEDCRRSTGMNCGKHGHAYIIEGGSTLPLLAERQYAYDRIATLIAERDAARAEVAKWHRAYTEANAINRDAVIAHGERVSALTRERDAAREANMTTTLVLAVARQDALDAQAERDSANTNWEAEHAECDRQFIARRKAEAERDAALAERDALREQIATFKSLVLKTRDELAANADVWQAQQDALTAERDMWQARATRAEITQVEARMQDKSTVALTEARRVLKATEWGNGDGWCRTCRGFDYEGHTADCALAAVLAQEEK